VYDARVTARPRAIVAWSSGKDSAWALHEARRAGEVEIVGILTTVTEDYGRVSMHGVREAVLDLQAAALGLPCHKVRIPAPCPHEVYAARMEAAVRQLVGDGVTEILFGDLFLEGIRDYRVERLAGTGMTPRFPLWGRPTRELARHMVDEGLRAILTSVDPRKLDRSFAGRTFDASLLDDLPDDVDPCAENGEFHSCVVAGPMFATPLAVDAGEVVERDGFLFADVVPR